MDDESVLLDLFFSSDPQMQVNACLNFGSEVETDNGPGIPRGYEKDLDYVTEASEWGRAGHRER